MRPPRPDSFCLVSELDGRVIAIAGAGGGLGPVVATRLADAGATLALADVTEQGVERVSEQLGLPDGRVDGQAVDLLDEKAANGWAASLVERFGRVDGLLHLVGGYRGGDPIESFDLSDYELLHDLLVRTLQLSSRAFHSALTGSAHGRFVLVSSSVAQSPSGPNAAYASAKAAAEAWTLALADSFVGSSATANVVVVNAILTPAMREENPDTDYSTFTPAEHIADAIAFLCSDSASRMNGKRLSLHP
jgi:NAD(P)-dependent dehydrogenase (short-subunit alcohol dehydrogenase family)